MKNRHRIISEALEITEASGEGAAITATLARGNMINRNRRYYSAVVLERAANASRDAVDTGKLIGLMDHPSWWNGDSDKGKPERTVIRWNRLYMDGADLKGEGTIVETALGRDLLAMKRARVHIGLSTNAYATSHFENAKIVPAEYDGDEDDLIQVIDEIEELLSVDVVNDPSNVYAAVEQEARLERVAYREERLRMTDKDKDVPVTEPADEVPAPLDIDDPAEQPTPPTPDQPENVDDPSDDDDEEVTEEDVRAALDEARAKLVELKRANVARVAAAQRGITSEALIKAAILTALDAPNDDAALVAVDTLLAATRSGNGSNRVPSPEASGAPKDDPLREQRREFTSRVN